MTSCPAWDSLNDKGIVWAAFPCGAVTHAGRVLSGGAARWFGRLDRYSIGRGLNDLDTPADAETVTLNITGDQFHPEWSYTIRPRKAAIK